MKDEITIYPFDDEKEIHELDKQLQSTKNMINTQIRNIGYVLARAIGGYIVVTINIGQENICPRRFEISKQGYKDAINYMNSTCCLSSEQGSSIFSEISA